MSSPKPVIVLVPGSFCPPSFYDSIISQLQQFGYFAVIIDLPSVGRRDPLPPATMSDDAAAIKTVNTTLANAGYDIILVTHSYGGVCGTESIQGLEKKTRETEGKMGGITKLLYTTSVVPPLGQSLRDLMGDLFPKYLIVSEDYMKHDVVQSGRLTFSDLPEAEGIAWAKRFPEHSTVSLAGKLSYPGWRDVEISWLFCEEDKILPPEFQEAVIKRLRDEEGKDVDVHRIKAAHCPNASKPDWVAEWIRKAAGEKI